MNFFVSSPCPFIYLPDYISCWLTGLAEQPQFCHVQGDHCIPGLPFVDFHLFVSQSARLSATKAILAWPLGNIVEQTRPSQQNVAPGRSCLTVFWFCTASIRPSTYVGIQGDKIVLGHILYRLQCYWHWIDCMSKPNFHPVDFAFSVDYLPTLNVDHAGEPYILPITSGFWQKYAQVVKCLQLLLSSSSLPPI